MSKISLAPDGSGTGIFTIASPGTNTNRTLTLPDDTGTIVTNSGNQAGSFTTLNTSGAVVFNDAGADVDFRVESDTVDHALFVEGSSGNVGIGVIPSTRLHALGADTSQRGQISAQGSSGNAGRMTVWNDSAYVGELSTSGSNLSLYTSGISIFSAGSAERMRIDSSGNVGIGTTSPAAKLHVNSGATAEVLRIEATTNPLFSMFNAGTREFYIQTQSIIDVWGQANKDMRFGTNDTERIRITSAGKVGIGTNAPDRKLVVLDSVDDNLPAAVITKTGLTGANSGLQVHTNEASASGGSFGFRVTSGSTYGSPTNEIIRVNQHGLCFNGNTAAADALDDYEEGTFTPSFTFSTSGSVTYSQQGGIYTKIGDTVFCIITLYLSAVSSPTGYAIITNLPFTAGSNENFVSSGTIGLARDFGSSFTNLATYINQNTTHLQVTKNNTNANYLPIQGSDLTAATGLYLSITYKTA